MKIIKKGREQVGWSKKLKCTGNGNGGGGCGSVLLVERGDLFRTESHARDESEYYVTFQCVNCGVKTDIGESGLPFRAADLPKRPRKIENDGFNGRGKNCTCNICNH